MYWLNKGLWINSSFFQKIVYKSNKIWYNINIVRRQNDIYKAKVKWNGNHYFAGEEVKGSKIEKQEDGTTWLFDDEPIPEFPFYGDGRDEWVEVDENTVIEENLK